MLEFISLLWAGEIIGLSFIATPIKFQASQYGATMPMLLAVGKVTFNVQNIIDIIMSILLIGVLAYRYIWGTPITPWILCVYVGVFAIVFIQTFYVLPILDVRTHAYIQGNPMPPSHHHLVFAILEGIKIILLLIYPIKSILLK